MMRSAAPIVCLVVLMIAAAAASYGEASRPISDAQFAAKAEEVRGLVAAGAQRDKKIGAAGRQGQSKVEITSFVFAGSRTRAAEICGKVTGGNPAISVVRVTVDPKSEKPGAYNVLAGRDGLFCAVVATYTGTAEASMADQEAASASAAAASVGESRN